MLGRVVSVEKPGYDEDGLATTEEILKETKVYDISAKGRMDRTVKSILPSSLGYADITYIYEYDEFGLVSRSGLDYDGGGALVEASKDRITDRESTYEYTGGQWYRVETSTIYPDVNSSTVVDRSVRKQQLTGLGAVDAEHGTLFSRMIATDIHGQDTEILKYVHLDNGDTSDVNEQKVTVVTDLPTSSQDAVVVTSGGRKHSSTSPTGV